MKRLHKLRASIAEKGIDALLISQPENLLYLSGFTGSSGWLFISEQNAILATDFRYVEQAKEESPYFQILQIKREFRDWLPGLVSDLGLHNLGFEANFISYEVYNKLSEAIKDNHVSLDLVPTTGMVDQLRSIKEPEELQFITKAVELVDVAFEQAKLVKGQPTVVIAHTVKGKGVSFMENNRDFHGKAPNAEEVKIALKELE